MHAHLPCWCCAHAVARTEISDNCEVLFNQLRGLGMQGLVPCQGKD
jgi:hypothetical protein